MIELTVVMTIIAIITIVGVPGLLAARNQYILDAVSEELISTIRDAQNRAISVQYSTQNNISTVTKVWGVAISGSDDSFKLVSINNSQKENDELVSGKTNLNPYSGVTIDKDLFIYYSAPFGKGYVCTTKPDETSWIESTNQEKDWETQTSSCGADQVLALSYKNQVQQITIKANGDVYAGTTNP